MKASVFIFITPLIIFSSCDLREREEAIRIREDSLNQKEMRLLLKERSLNLKEQELIKKDSSLISDTMTRFLPALSGDWTVNMTCTETTCTGSAVGDKRKEHWLFSYQGNHVLAKAMDGDQLVRSYSGFSKANVIELEEDVQDNGNANATRMTVRLRMVNETRMEGVREIIRPNNCKIVYDLELSKL